MQLLSYSQGQKITLVLLRIFIGWHFLYEGVIKLYNPSWTAKGYLISAEGPFQSFFVWLAGQSLIGWIDTVNIAGLMLVGLLLLLGVFTRFGAIVGVLLLSMYYLAHPALPGYSQALAEGSYWLINKNLIELVALLVIFYFPTSHIFGIEVFLNKSK